MRAAERQRHRLEARAEALARQVADESAGPDADVLAEASGVLGVLKDLVDVDDGWVAAFEAAVGAALSAIVVEGAGAARAVLGALHEHEVVGTVLAATSVSARSSVEGPSPTPSPSWDTRSQESGTSGDGGELLRPHVRPRVPAVAGVLDHLLRDVVVVRGDWARAVDVALERPEVTVVSTDGDRFSSAGWVVRAGAHALATLAAQAAVEAGMAAEAADRASAFLDQARDRSAAALSEAGDVARQADRAEDQRQGLEATLPRVQSEIELVGQEWAEAERHRASLAERLEREGAELVSLTERLPELEAAATAAAGRLAVADEARRRLEERRSHVAVLRRDLEVKMAGLVERRAVLSAAAGRHRAPARRQRGRARAGRGAPPQARVGSARHRSAGGRGRSACGAPG